MLPSGSRCAICGRGITKVEARLHRTCSFWKCRLEGRRSERARRQESLERGRRRREDLRRQARRLRDGVAGSQGIGQPESFVPQIVPAASRPLTDLPEGRREALREHLLEVMSQACTPHDDSSSGTPQAETSSGATEEDSEDLWVSTRVCGICKGSCCTTGGDHAYLDVSTIRRYMHEHSGAAAAEVLEAFLARVEPRTYRDSCVYHGKNGCGLPRSMRSETCNAFCCAELREVHSGLSGDGPRRVFFAAAEGDAIMRFAFVDFDESLHTGVFPVGRQAVAADGRRRISSGPSPRGPDPAR